jgi:hypothetical protein
VLPSWTRSPKLSSRGVGAGALTGCARSPQTRYQRALNPSLIGGKWCEAEYEAATLKELCAAGGLAGNAGPTTAEGYIVVETNFRVYAYTASKLALAKLRMFTRCAHAQCATQRCWEVLLWYRPGLCQCAGFDGYIDLNRA